MDGCLAVLRDVIFIWPSWPEELSMFFLVHVGGGWGVGGIKLGSIGFQCRFELCAEAQICPSEVFKLLALILHKISLHIFMKI